MDSNFGEILRELREKRGLAVNQLGMYSKVSPALISKIENGKRGTPKPDTIRKLAKGLKIEFDVLMKLAGHVKNNQLPQDAIPYNPDEMIKLPILGTIRAGEPIYMSEHIEGYELVDPGMLRGQRGYLLRVKGDSMTGDRIYEGDRVLVIQIEEVNPSDIAVVAIDGEEATLKRVKCINDQCVLSSSNPAYEPMFYPANQVHILGKVIEVRHSIG